ncbi:MAG: hypothetical protein JXA77_11610, partial [Bacteroidales bacterium]|nr:hypothetical protein [Bacteroidales bacterium]
NASLRVKRSNLFDSADCRAVYAITVNKWIIVTIEHQVYNGTRLETRARCEVQMQEIPGRCRE